MRMIRDNERGAALITSLLVSMAILAIAFGVLYVISMSTSMSGAGKRYATAAEAADGAIEMAKDSINIIKRGGGTGDIAPAMNVTCGSGGGTTSLVTAINNQGVECRDLPLNLSGTTIGTTYTARVSVTQIFSTAQIGSGLEFGRGGPTGSTVILYYRISVKVDGSDKTRAENAALYRFTG